MRVVIRTDASLEIGTGHVMRCLTLAASLRERGAETLFVCRQHSGNLIEPIRKKGFEVLTLPIERSHGQQENSGNFAMPQHASWLGADWQGDAHSTLAALWGKAIDWIVVDHYALNADWEQFMRPACRRIMVIDDLADRPHDCDLLLDQNLGRQISDYDGLVPEGCIRLIGPKFALLRPEFAALRNYSLARRSPPVLKHLLISMGGVDRGNATGEILQAVRECPLPEDCRISVVMGPHAPWLSQVREQAAVMSWTTRVLVGVNNMAQLMADSDLAIGAAGGTAWERCCLGLPSLLLVLAENQHAGAVALHNSGAAIALKACQKIPEVLHNLLSVESINSPLLKMVQDAAVVSDGAGADRVLAHLRQSALSARVVTGSDEMLLFIWVNDTLTRLNAFGSAQIPLADHQAWLAGRLAKPENCSMFIIERGNESIGQVRLDRNDAGEWEIDYSVCPSCRGQGLGATVLACGLSAFAADRGSAQLVAEVKRNNLASCRVFESLGYKMEEGTADIVVYRKTLARTAP